MKLSNLSQLEFYRAEVKDMHKEYISALSSYNRSLTQAYQIQIGRLEIKIAQLESESN